jgi:hypothetical protein
MNRRGLLGSILAAAAAPMLVQAGVLMPVKAERLILWGDGIHDDTAALQALFDGGTTDMRSTARIASRAGRLSIERGSFLLSAPLVIQRPNVHIAGCMFRSKKQLPHMLQFGREAVGCSVYNSAFSGGGLHLEVA